MEENSTLYWKWDDSLALGIEVIDGQHKRIVDYINELHQAHREGLREKVDEVLQGLVDYTISHFSFEENLMAEGGYPLSDAHRQVHHAFTKRIEEYRRQHQSGKDVARQLIAELQIWLTNHIRNDDRDYRPYAKKALKRQGGWLGRALRRFFG